MSDRASSDDRIDLRDLVAEKRAGKELTPDEIRTIVLGYARGDVPDYLAAVFLMAAYIHGLSMAETVAMTKAMVESGSTLPLEGITRPKVDKHSTGGVSDGVTLVFAPLAASLGLAVAKLSGRGLEFTGGTLDKLESIPGLRTDLLPEDIERQAETIGCVVAAQSDDLVPADRAFYALRDATATVSSIPFIAASVMSKKLAVGTDLILLDVKAGSGAFMKTPEAAAELAETCIGLAGYWDRLARAAVTDMSQPLGSAIGNALEVAEAIRLLKGEERGRLRELSVAFAAEALAALEGQDRDSGRKEAERVLDSGEAAETFARMVEAQGGNARVVDDPIGILPRAPVVVDVTTTGGYVAAVDAEALGRSAGALGAGRVKKGDPIDPAVGIEFFPKIGDLLVDGERIAVVHARDEQAAKDAGNHIGAALILSNEPVDPPPLIFGWFGESGSHRLAGSMAPRREGEDG